MKAASTQNFKQYLVKPAKKLWLYFWLLLGAVVVLFPVFFALSVALQGPTPAPKLWPDWSNLDWGIFVEAFQKEPNLVRWVINSLVVSFVATLGVLFTSVLAGYALFHPQAQAKTFFLFVCLGTVMIPFEATIIPNYLFVIGLGWKDSYQGLIAPFLASGFGVFLMRQYFLTIPFELYEAAIVDGCGSERYLRSFLIPLSRPALATLAVYTFLNTWNQYYWPLLITDATEWRTSQVGITIFRSNEIQVFNLQMAATLIILFPTLILLVLAQRQLIQGLTAGALKG